MIRSSFNTPHHEESPRRLRGHDHGLAPRSVWEWFAAALRIEAKAVWRHHRPAALVRLALAYAEAYQEETRAAWVAWQVG